MQHTRETSGPYDAAEAELIVEAIGELADRARRYVQEPADFAWRDLCNALTRACGDSTTYDLLRAVEIHTRSRSGSR